MSNIVLIGLVSFFVDISTEMVYPIIPLYLTGTFGATPAIVGLVEGIAESLASLLKVLGGYLSDRYKKKKRIAFIGYSTSLLYKIALVLSASWWGILAARVIDRLGKGIRTSPRDLLVAESSDKNKLGSSFGLHKALDMAGSAIGILLAYVFLRTTTGTGQYKTLFMVSMIPSFIGLAILLKVKEKGTASKKKDMGNLIEGFRNLDSRLKLFLVTAFVFTLGNSSNAFLLLRARDAGYDSATVVLLYFVYNVVSSLLALPLGKLSDKVGRRKLLVAGYLVFGAVYTGFAVATSKYVVALLFALYGVYTAMTAGVERALVSELAPSDLKGTTLGLHSTLVGIGLLPASVFAGLLWDGIGPSAPFFFGGSLAVISAIALFFILKDDSEKLA
jgi:MFS family permease